MNYKLFKKVFLTLLDENITFSSIESQQLMEYNHLFAQHQMENILLLLYQGNSSLVEILMKSGQVEEQKDIEKKDLIYDKFFKLFDVLLQLEGSASSQDSSEKDDAQLAQKFSEQFYKLFAGLNEEEINLYLKNYFNKFVNTGSKHPIYDLCNFTLNTENNISYWRDLLFKYGPKMARKYFPLADKIEKYCEDNHLNLPKNKKELESFAIRAVYARAQEDETFANECLKKQIPEDAFDLALDIFKSKSKKNDNLPDILLDGKEIKLDRFYLKKIPCTEKIGFILGKYTDCCQHIAHEMGKDASILGMTSPNSGFYVLMKRPIKQGPEEIIAQSWAWLSKEGYLVFDSWEFLRERDKGLLVPFMKQLSAVAEKYQITGIFLGASGGTPKDLPFSKATVLPEPLDESGFRDSKLEQWIIKSPAPNIEQKP